jgi:hypothetical protein
MGSLIFSNKQAISEMCKGGLSGISGGIVPPGSGTLRTNAYAMLAGSEMAAAAWIRRFVVPVSRMPCTRMAQFLFLFPCGSMTFPVHLSLQHALFSLRVVFSLKQVGV